MADKDLDELKSIIVSTQALISHLLTSLKSNPDPPAITSDTETSPNALALSSSVASLIHGQTTKLALLVVNKPFTPTAISKIIKTLSAQCIPALASAAQLAASSRYARCVHSAVVDGARTILLEFQALLREIPVDEHGVEQTQSRGTFSYTGVIWGACDKLKEAGDGGVCAIAESKAEGWRALVQDAAEELREWWEAGKEDEGKDEDDADDSEDEGDSLDFSMDSKCAAKMLPVAGQLISVIDHIRLLYPPLIKRRIRRFPELKATTKLDDFPAEKTSAKIDWLLTSLETLHDEVDQAAFVLYEQGPDEAVDQMKKLADLGEKCASSMALTWTAESDVLTAWISDKYLPKLQELAEAKITDPAEFEIGIKRSTSSTEMT